MSNKTIGRKIYFISGLGANCSAFDRLILPLGYEKVYLEWNRSYFIKPEIPTIARYFSKLILEDDAIVIGLSFGGMVLTEIAKTRPNLHPILLSSIPSKLYFPPTYDWLLKFRAHKLVQKWQIKLGAPIFKRLMNNRQDEATQLKTQEMLDQTDMFIFKQSVEAMRRWQNHDIPNHIIQIHGNKDVVLPKTFKIDYLVDGGSHFMVWEKTSTISKILKEILAKY